MRRRRPNICKCRYVAWTICLTFVVLCCYTFSTLSEPQALPPTTSSGPPHRAGLYSQRLCTGLGKGFNTSTFGLNKWSCEYPIVNVGHAQWRSLNHLGQFERYLVLGTYEDQDFLKSGPGRFPLPPLSRFHTLSYASPTLKVGEAKS